MVGAIYEDRDVTSTLKDTARNMGGLQNLAGYTINRSNFLFHDHQEKFNVKYAWQDKMGVFTMVYLITVCVMLE